MVQKGTRSLTSNLINPVKLLEVTGLVLRGTCVLLNMISDVQYAFPCRILFISIIGLYSFHNRAMWYMFTVLRTQTLWFTVV